MEKLKIGVLMGGISSEREISLQTGEEIVKNLDRDKYEALPIVINSKEDILDLKGKIDFAFLALHGKFGEDGTIQSVLQTLNIPYSGCGSLSSSICMDKDITKKILSSEGIPMAPYFMVTENDISKSQEKALNIGYPVFVKPNGGGSSVATNLVKKGEILEENIKKALEYDKEVMVEKYIKGEEITCCILDGDILPVLVIKPKAEFFDYVAKYTEGASLEDVVVLEDVLMKKVTEIAAKCYSAMKCSVYARVDMIISEGTPYVLELNTLPGFTKNSLFPKSAKSVGISFTELISIIINKSLKVER